jgi:hypothetical protein
MIRFFPLLLPTIAAAAAAAVVVVVVVVAVVVVVVVVVVGVAVVVLEIGFVTSMGSSARSWVPCAGGTS